MLILTATTDKIQLVTENSEAIAVHASVVDHTLSSDNIEASVQNTSIASATTTDIIAAPASGVTRNVRTLVIRNGGTSPNIVTVRYDQNGTTFDLFKAQLSTDGELFFADGIGFKALNPTKFYQRFTTARDMSVDNNFWRDVPEMNFWAKAGKTYFLEFDLIVSTSGPTNGIRVGLNGPASPTYLRIAGIGTKTASATAAVFTTQASSISAYDTSYIGATLDATAGTNALVIGRGVIVPSSTGMVVARFQSEAQVAAGAVIRQGSIMTVREPDNV